MNTKTQIAKGEIVEESKELSTPANVEESNNELSQASTPLDQYFNLVAMAMRNGDLNQAQQMMQMKQEFEANEARKSFNNAMAVYSANIPAIVKDKKGHNNKYATLANIVDLVRPEMSSCGLSHNWSFEQRDNNTVTVFCTFNHRDGHSKTVELTASFDLSGNKSDIHGLGSTISYLERYTFKAMAGIAEKDDDGEKASIKPAELISEEQSLELFALITENKYKVEDWLRHFRSYERNMTLEKLDDLPLKYFARSKQNIVSAIKEAEKNKKNA